MTSQKPTTAIEAPVILPGHKLTAQEHEDLGALTLFKIQNIYHLQPKDWALPSEQKDKIDFEIDDFAAGEDWAEKCNKQIKFDKLNAAEGNALKIKLQKFAHQFLHEYIQGTCLREAIMNVPEEKVSSVHEGYYAIRHARINMGDEYISHISNRAYLTLKEMGLSERGILSMHGKIISEAMDIDRMLGTRHCKNIEPAYLDLAKDPETLNSHINKHWERCRAKTQEQKAMPGYP